MIRSGNIRQWLVIPEFLAERIPAKTSKERSEWIRKAILQRIERDNLK
jgi:metal-responsive CopG/Arc/MetJ family transcriptional regulator